MVHYARQYVQEDVAPLAAKLFMLNPAWLKRRMGAQYGEYAAASQAGLGELGVHDPDWTKSLMMSMQALGIRPPDETSTPNFDKAVRMLADAGVENAAEQGRAIKTMMRDVDTFKQGIQARMPD